MRNKQKELTSAKKERLSLSQLAGYDDILTDALVDHVYYWTTIRKNRSKYNLTRGINEDDITHILLHEIVVAKDPQKAEASFLKLPGIRKYNDSLTTNREKEDFRRHLRKYINIWMPDCPFEVSTTNRYTIVTHEAAVTARLPIKKGTVIKYLCGQLVSMTPEEELDRDLTRRDFSIVMSSRKKTPSFFLGPARFANHDCDANARLTTRGSDAMEVVAVRDIEIGDEITVTYGDNYFGEGNSECLCESCEKKGHGGWPSQEQSRSATGTATPAEAGLEVPGPYGLRSTKRRASHSDATPTSTTPETFEGNPRKKPRLNAQRLTSTEKEGKTNDGKATSQGKSHKRASGLRNELVPACDTRLEPGSSELAASTTIDQPDGPSPKEDDDLVASVKAAFAKAKSHGKRKRDTSDLPDSVEYAKKIKGSRSSSKLGSRMSTRDSVPIIDVPETPRTPNNPRMLTTNAVAKDKQSSSSPSGTSSTRNESIPPSSTPATSLDPNDMNSDPSAKLVKTECSESELSDLPNGALIDDTTSTIIFDHTVLAKPLLPSPAVLPTVELPALTAIDDPITSTKSTTRAPGDYIRTPLLLGEKYSRWVDCRTCSGTWVQANSYLTRKECPRCERHSKLYGYRWPKTEKINSGDGDRVMDHRTVHRFIRPEEEKRIRKKGRGLTADEGEELEEEEIEEEEVVEKPVEKNKKKPKPKTRPGWKGWVELPIKRGRGRPRKNRY